MRVIATSLIALSLTATGAQAAIFSAAAAKSKLTSDLPDPEATHFRNTRAFHVKKSGETAYCGEMNIKNRLGAYVGYRKFVVFPDHVTLAPEEEASDQLGQLSAALDQAMLDNICKGPPLAVPLGPVKF